MASHLKIQGITIICALIVHVFFNRLEPRNEFIWFSLLICLPSVLGLGLQSFYKSTFYSICETQLVFLGTLVSSVVIYRLSPLHPLYRYPGPIFLKISRFSSLKVLFSGKQHKYYQQLHEKYGPYIRTGPNHLHISDSKAIPGILGSNRFHKSDRYDAISLKLDWEEGAETLLDFLDPKEHAKRRRIWDRGLNTAALKGYQGLLSNRIDQLVAALHHKSTKENTEVDLYKWISLFTIDFMGDLAWGGVFNYTNEGEDKNGICEMSRMVTLIHEAAGTIPWVQRFYNYLPASAETEEHLQFAKGVILQRINRGPSETRDLFSHLIGEDDTTGETLSVDTLVLETSFALVAGTETSAITLANVFFYLLLYPDTLASLTAELDKASADLSPNKLASLPYLNAVLNETLRLQPIVPNGVQRVLITGPSGQGVVINNRYIPPQTNLQISTYCVQRDSVNFSPYPDRFWPERWLPNIQDSLSSEERDAFRLDEQAYFPFSYGPTGCAGKALALLEMRAVIAAVLSNFELRFANGWKAAEWEDNLMDFYTLRGGSLPVILAPRMA